MLRENLIEKTEEALDTRGFGHCRCIGCFDIAARKRSMFLIKVLVNIDAFQHEQSMGLGTLSQNIDASPVIIGSHTRYEKLNNDIIYERFDIPSMTLNTFVRMIDNDLPYMYRFRGGLYAKISAKKLRLSRKAKGLSQRELAQSAGVSKKSIYEHESSDKPMSYNTTIKIRKILHQEILEPIAISDFHLSEDKSLPSNMFEKDVSRRLTTMGFDIDFIRKAPFNMLASEKMTLILDAEENTAEKNISYIRDFAELVKRPAMLVTKSNQEFDMPAIQKKELDEISSPRELLRMLKRW
ncbi:MAG: hypothetical protein V1802_02540 [Candidatus Aenigmatarchaeota archaeon]